MAQRMDRAERRESILATAMAIIDEQGHQGLTMRSLARGCGLSAPGLMHYFPDMPTLVVAVVAYREERDEEFFVIDEPGPGATRRMLDQVIENIIARPKAAELFAIVEAQAIDPRHPGHEYFKRRSDALVEEFAPMVGVEYANPEQLLRQLISISDGLQLNWLREPEAFDLRERWRAIADPLLLAAARCPAPPPAP